MQSSTVVRRTEAGSAELAVPAHGLSLTQRRFLTLLDTARTIDELAPRHRAEAAKVERDLARLTELGFVVCDIEAPANDAEAAPPATVRLGASSRGRRLLLLLPIAAVALAFAGWHQWTTFDVAAVDGTAAAEASRKTTHDVQDAPIDDPQPIATRVLKSDSLDRPRDGVKEPRKGGEAHAEKAATRPSLPVEHRSPAPEDLAARRTALDVPVRMSLDTPTGTSPIAAERPASIPRAPLAAPARTSADSGTAISDKRIAPVATPAASLATAATPTIMAPAAPTPAPAPAIGAARAPTVARADTPPVQVASAVPAAGLLQGPPASALVPTSRESPTFPREAIALGLARGEVKARVTIDARGNVTDVVIVDASHRAFSRAVREALAHWRFPPGAAGRTTTIDVAFKRD